MGRAHSKFKTPTPSMISITHYIAIKWYISIFRHRLKIGLVNKWIMLDLNMNEENKVSNTYIICQNVAWKSNLTIIWWWVFLMQHKRKQRKTKLLLAVYKLHLVYLNANHLEPAPKPSQYHIYLLFVTWQICLEKKNSAGCLLKTKWLIKNWTL